ncbi:hypothetical protein SteCoe_473 [Stentor coeruleus]|uniref:Uncharacterized protein n=1 Tax=Stentor coeruleus TaxID=5963 RepID=A0A1R2D491_9CILI|nr:hypothetical protein SteCoe_473 [Stentor coeruleus]
MEPTEKDLTMNRNIAAKNTFHHIFPIYAPQFTTFKSTTKTKHSQSADFNDDSEFSLHNQDLHKKVFNKKADRMVHYNEAMLRVKNMRAIKK